ncbi:MAG: hypothetical protein WDK96_00465 [Candidatus Paceibacterota bacterium]
MRIRRKPWQDLNLREDLKPLFEAMSSGKVIKKVTVGTKERVIDNFIAVEYNVGISLGEKGLRDLVDTNTDEAFYMDSVKSFEL